MPKLIDVVPHEFLTSEYFDIPAQKYALYKVIKEHDGRVDPWPGKHRFVYFWWELEKGVLVGFNENPSRGWSFPVIGKKKRKNNEPVTFINNVIL